VCRAVIGRRHALRSLPARTDGSRSACVDSVPSRFDLHNPLNSTVRMTGHSEVWRATTQTALGESSAPKQTDPGCPSSRRTFTKKGYYPGITRKIHDLSSLFDGLPTLCYIELPRGKFSAAMLFVRSANLRFIKCLNRSQEAI
jgi:hypothetical protein